MRGAKDDQTELFCYFSLESRVPQKHPLRDMRELCDAVLGRMDRDFNRIYSHTGRPSAPPEMLLKATLLQVLYGIRSEKVLLEQIDFSFLYRWFLGLSMDDEVWTNTTTTMIFVRIFAREISRHMSPKISIQDGTTPR